MYWLIHSLISMLVCAISDQISLCYFIMKAINSNTICTFDVLKFTLTFIQGLASLPTGVQQLAIPKRPSIARSHIKPQLSNESSELAVHAAPEDADATLTQTEATGTKIEFHLTVYMYITYTTPYRFWHFEHESSVNRMQLMGYVATVTTKGYIIILRLSTYR